MQHKVRTLSIIIALGLMIGFLALFPSPALADPLPLEEPTVTIYFFWGDGCPHCAEAHPFLQELADIDGVELVEFEVWNNDENLDLLMRVGEAYGYKPHAVPNIIIGDRYWEGYTKEISREITTQVETCLISGCPDHVAAVISGDSATAPAPEATTNGPIIDVPFIGEVDLGKHSLTLSTALIAFVDGVNPCSIWVLSILLALTLHTGSRKKVLVIGLIFLTVTSFVYVIFIAGLFTALTVASYLTWIQSVVALLSLFFALVNIKDYFWYKEGLSFTIADEKKPGIYKNIRRVMNTSDAFLPMAGATIALGFGVSFVEFSCTAGFPVLWTNLVSAQKVEPMVFGLLLFLYMVIYQLDELAIFLVAVFTLKSSKLEEKHGRILKLIGGMLMFTLAIVMLFNPALMNDLSSSLLIFGIAFGLTVIVLVVHRLILPRFGIIIGSEEITPEPALPDNKL